MVSSACTDPHHGHSHLLSDSFGTQVAMGVEGAAYTMWQPRSGGRGLGGPGKCAHFPVMPLPTGK